MKKSKISLAKKVLVVMGTRPEVIKLAPVVEALQVTASESSENNKVKLTKSNDQRPEVRFKTIICLTGQHREMVEPFLKVFGLKPDYDLRVMRSDQHLTDLTGRVLVAMKKVLEIERPDWLLVQGDTTSAMAAALAAFYQKIKVGHVEAGLRTEDKYNPFPEEINRRLISHLADLHFAPTELAKKNLLAEGIMPEKIFVTGNTVVDALKMILKKTKGVEHNQRPIVRIEEFKASPRTMGERSRKGRINYKEKQKPGREAAPINLPGEINLQDLKKFKKLILVTAHRRESFGRGMEGICQAINKIVAKASEAEVIFPVHLNPAVRRVVSLFLQGQERIHLVEPLDYITFVHLMTRADLILTDSGGIQEEAPSLGAPVVVMRERTERPEAIEAGVAWLAGTDPDRITSIALRLLKEMESREFRKQLQKKNPFGDGRAALRISRLLKKGDTLSCP
jgi:UDP-N-acetylglucosamine 2-epimerase (non-hydrolysing)